MIEHLAKDLNDLQTAKVALLVLNYMVITWGGPDVVTQPTLEQNGVMGNTAPQPKLPGFDQFMMTRFSPLCWALPSNADFDAKDAVGRQVLGEAASLQKSIYAKTGQEYLSWLRDVELIGMGMDTQTIEDYLRALCTYDAKGFRLFFQVCPFSLEK